MHAASVNTAIAPQAGQAAGGAPVSAVGDVFEAMLAALLAGQTQTGAAPTGKDAAVPATDEIEAEAPAPDALAAAMSLLAPATQQRIATDAVEDAPAETGDAAPAATFESALPAEAGAPATEDALDASPAPAKNEQAVRPNLPHASLNAQEHANARSAVAQLAAAAAPPAEPILTVPVETPPEQPPVPAQAAAAAQQAAAETGRPARPEAVGEAHRTGKPQKPAHADAKAAARTDAAPANEEARAAEGVFAVEIGEYEPAPQTVEATPGQDFAPETAVDPAPPVSDDATTQAAPLASHAPASADTPKAGPTTVAHLTAQIVQKLEQRTTRFDVELEPHGLGKVDVRIEIGARGDVSASLTFDNPQAAAELRHRSGELHAALEQAGFDPSRTSLNFSSGGQAQQHQAWTQQDAPVWRGRAFTDLADADLSASTPPPARRSAAGGVDVFV